MFKNLNCEVLGISGRQSEIIELALTYGFRGIDLDLADMVKRCQRGSFESASRFLTSSKLKVGGFEAPIDLDSDDESFTAQAALLNNAAEIAGRAGAKTAIVRIPYETSRLPYPEYFEVIRKRIDDIVAVFAKEGVRVALSFSAMREPEAGDAKEFKFVQDVEGFLALAKSCNGAGIVFDSWHWFCGKGTEEHLDQFGVEKVFAVRLSDCVEGVAPESATYDDCLLPGSTDVIDNVSFLKKFAAAKLKLPVAACGRLPEPGGTRDAFVGKVQDSLDKSFKAAEIPSETRKPESFAEASYASNYQS